MRENYQNKTQLPELPRLFTQKMYFLICSKKMINTCYLKTGFART